MAHTYNGISLSHIKKRNWVICSEVDGPRDYRTKWSKSDKERQISYDMAYMWNLNKKQKIQMNLSPKQKENHRHRKQTYG